MQNNRFALASFLTLLYVCTVCSLQFRLVGSVAPQPKGRLEAAFAEYTGLNHLSPHTQTLPGLSNAAAGVALLPFLQKPFTHDNLAYPGLRSMTDAIHFLKVLRYQRFFPASLMHRRKANLLFPFHYFW
jgi:hypothetical protein